MAFEKKSSQFGPSVRGIVRELYLSSRLYTDAELRAEVERRVGHPVKPQTIAHYKYQLRATGKKNIPSKQNLNSEVAEHPATYVLRTPTEFSMAEAKRDFAEICTRAEYAHEKIIVTKHGRPVAAIVGISDLEKWKALEDKQAIEIIERVLASSRGFVKADLDWLRKEAGLGSDPSEKPVS